MTSGSPVGGRSAESNPLLSLMEPEIQADPYPLLKRLREAGPIEAENGSVIIVGDYNNSSKILRDRQMSSDPNRSPLLRNFPRSEVSLNSSIFFMDPPEHTHQRKLVSTLFTPRTISDAEPSIRSAVDQLFHDLEGKSEVDVVQELSYPLSHAISCDLFGIPYSERATLRSWADDIGKSSEITTIGAGVGATRLYSWDEIERIARTIFSVHAYFGDLAHRRRKNPGDDIISRLVAAAAKDAGFGRSELGFGLLTVFSASYESTINLITNGILSLLRHPKQLAILRNNPTVISSAVDEVLRYDPPAHIIGRVSTATQRIGDFQVDPDKAIIILVGAANRDPDVYPSPDRFDVLRKPESMPLSFGAGAHFCVGVSLAKLTAEVALSAFVERLKDVEVVEESLSYRPRITSRGLERLVIRFRPR